MLRHFDLPCAMKGSLFVSDYNYALHAHHVLYGTWVNLTRTLLNTFYMQVHWYLMSLMYLKGSCFICVIQNANAVRSGILPSTLSQSQANHYRDVMFTCIREQLITKKCAVVNCVDPVTLLGEWRCCDNCRHMYHWQCENIRTKPTSLWFCSNCMSSGCWYFVYISIVFSRSFNFPFLWTLDHQCTLHCRHITDSYKKDFESYDHLLLVYLCSIFYT